MSFQIRVFRKTAGDRTCDVHELIDANGTVRAEVWPEWGFNCLRWQVRQPDGNWGSILFTAPDWETNPVPTRSGHPILFPFPGRLRNGTFTFEGKTYSLPRNDSTKQHAIHGFTPRNRWRVIKGTEAEKYAELTGQFQLSRDLPEALAYWPGDFLLNVTYRLERDRLRVVAHVENSGGSSLPFGLGYHPYFRLPGVTEVAIAGHVLRANMSCLWETDQNLPTGNRIAIPPDIDFRRAHAIGLMALDSGFTSVRPEAIHTDGMIELAELSHPNAIGKLSVRADPAFRELVLFIPEHRQAVAIEPYTCAADGANLATRGIDSGWRVLGKGQLWKSMVDYLWHGM